MSFARTERLKYLLTSLNEVLLRKRNSEFLDFLEERGQELKWRVKYLSRINKVIGSQKFMGWFGKVDKDLFEPFFFED